MATTKQARGTKRTCQSDECGARFYDLNRDPIACPICGTIYVIASGPVGVLFKDEEKVARKAKKEVVKDDEAVDAVEEEIEDIEDTDTVDEEADDTFLEDEEEDGGDVTNIVGGRGGEGEEV